MKSLGLLPSSPSKCRNLILIILVETYLIWDFQLVSTLDV